MYHKKKEYPNDYWSEQFLSILAFVSEDHACSENNKINISSALLAEKYIIYIT
jgi:hypothetical protein